MANIELPIRFKNIIDKNQQLDGLLKSTLHVYGEILLENKLYFFPEFTDHGVKHIENVLIASDNLITDDTYENILTDKDLVFYTLSVILHDIGMHINLDGFNTLIEGDYDSVKVEQFDTLNWKELWEDFLNEAKKFSGKQLKNIFGNENLTIRIPQLNNPGEITENDKKLKKVIYFINKNVNI